MKIKPTQRQRKVLMEVGPGESSLLAESKASEERLLFSLKRILVPIDFSECSKKALQYAIPFARQFNASLTLVYVVQIPYGIGEGGVMEMERLRKEMGEDGQRKLKEMLAENIAEAVPFESTIRQGNPYEEIIHTAREKESDLIILSTHGHSGFRHLLLGSTAERVVRHAPCPVLVVREQEHEFVESEEGNQRQSKKPRSRARSQK